jgi:hypothetical protein
VSRILLGFAFLALLMGHDHGGCRGNDGIATRAECDPALTWDGFGRDFMANYCTSCHSSLLRGGARKGAPEDHNYDSLEGVQQDPTHVDVAAGAGPEGVNDFMPPYGRKPTAEERQQLSRWLACGAP